MTIKTLLRFCEENGISHGSTIFMQTESGTYSLKSMDIGSRATGNGIKQCLILRHDNRGKKASNPIPGGTRKGDKRGNKK